MSKYWIAMMLASAVCAASIGCDGRQKGQFAISGWQSRSLAMHDGCLVIARGTTLTRDYQPTGPEKPLLYCLILSRGIQGSASGREGNDGTYISTHRFKWLTIKWDRRYDTIEIHGKEFSRASGGIFIAFRDSSGTVSVSQYDAEMDHLDPFRVMEKIRNVVDDDLVSEVRLEI